MTSTVIQTGSFTSTGNAVELEIRSDVDYMETINFTQMATTQTPGRGVKFEWFRGMDVASSIEISKLAGVDTLEGDIQTSNGFTLLDTSDQTPGTLVSTITIVSGATPPVVTTSAPHGLSAGDVVRMIDITGAQQLGGMPFTIGNDTLTGTTFSLDFMQTIVAATTGSFRQLFNQPEFAPRRRFITDISQALSAVITMSVVHGLTVGQAIRVQVSADFGMTEIDGLIGNITAIDTATNTITVDIDSSSFTSFTFPLTAGTPFTNAQVIPVGQAAQGTFGNNLDDATDNQSFIGMELGAGINGPAGSSGDVVFWKAIKSSLVDNT